MTYWVAGAAAVGALLDRKQPLRGAALGAGTALTGGAALGAVGGGAAAGGAATAGSAAGAGGLLGTGTAATAGTTATIGGASAAAPVAASGAAPVAAGSTGSFGTQAMGYIKPIGQAASAANAVQGLMPQSQPVTTPPPQFGGGAGSQAFNGLLQDSMATEQARLQEEMRKREAQQKLIGLIGGR